jgi:hypothetical protein
VSFALAFFSPLSNHSGLLSFYTRKFDDLNFFSHFASSKKLDLETVKKHFVFLGCGFDWQGGISGRIPEVSGGS